jgi:hypothetical protein
MGTSIPRINMLLISLSIQLRFVNVVPKYLYFATFSKALVVITKCWYCAAFWWSDIILFSLCFLPDPSPYLPQKRHSEVFFTIYIYIYCFHRTYQHCHHRLGADTFYSILILPDFHRPSWWHIPKQFEGKKTLKPFRFLEKVSDFSYTEFATGLV